MRRLSLVFLTVLIGVAVFAQPQPPSVGVGNAILLATNSIQIDRDAAVVSGDVIVNAAPLGPVLGEQSLSLDRNVTTPAGFKIAATSIDIDQSAVVSGDAYYNTLSNEGTISGTRVTPLALPVFATLPPVIVRSPGSTPISVADGATLALDAGAYGDVVVGRGATLRLTGGNYAFRSLTLGRGGALRYAAAVDVVIAGNLDCGSDAVVAPVTGSALTTASLRMQVDGTAAHAGQSSTIKGTLYATAGSLILDRNVAGTGAFLARDIEVGMGSRLTLDSIFNLPPTADPQRVFTSGTSPLTITITGSDPEGSPLTFDITAAPSAGTLSAPVTVGPFSATVTYAPAAANVFDTFTFRVRDRLGASGVAVVTINPRGDPPPPAPATVVAIDSSAETTSGVPVTLLLRGAAPAGVSLTFAILANSGPSHGTLGPVTQSTVVYTPDSGYVGPDLFRFQVCGVIANANVCDDATFAITVLDAVVDPPGSPYAIDVVTTAGDTALISLGENSTAMAGRRFAIAPRAAVLQPVAVAGNVADANGDGIGDNANDLPGAVPVFMSAGVHQSGGAGSNGTMRMQFEWDLSAARGSIDALQSAEVILPTHRGTVDSLDTFFYHVGVSGDGLLAPSDFEQPAEQIAAVVMPVPANMPVGAEGTFSFSVLGEVQDAVHAGFKFLTIQGRVNESINATARGLEVRTSASGNAGNLPMLALATGGMTVPLQYRITSLPQSGTLFDGLGRPITNLPYTLPTAQVKYASRSGFAGVDAFHFDVHNGSVVSQGIVTIHVFLIDCRYNAAFCDNGRDVSP